MTKYIFVYQMLLYNMNTIIYWLNKYKLYVKHNPVLLGKYWTEHMLGYFQPTYGLKV